MIAKLALCATSLYWAAPSEAPPATPSAPIQQGQPAQQAQPASQAQPAQPTQQPQPAQQTQAQPVPPKAAKLELHPIEEQIIQLTNFERSRYGLPALEVDPALMQSARQHATWMTTTQRMVHTRQPVAENIAMGQPTGNDALRSWMNSPGHRANILNRGHGRIGVAAYRSVSGAIYWCQQFRR